ncbi:MAG TPA: 3-oxo-tetronate 4-phosphate decarboxylase [Xanthomonadales bacterium]|nr:3-oxo-tetronate 4-phosphate decarboxylase [Xanthomonadales bacterium]
MSHAETKLRDQIAMHGQSLHERGLVPGSSGNISAFLEDGVLVTPTNSCLGRLDPARIAKLDWNGNHVDGDKPSKEGFLHLLMYGKRPDARACVHLHSTHAVAVSCCEGLDTENVIPPLTPYYVMKIGRLPLIPYFMPGDEALAREVEKVAGDRHAMLLANHGPVVAGKSIDQAVYAMEELEESARLFLMLRNEKTARLSQQQISELEARFPS